MTDDWDVSIWSEQRWLASSDVHQAVLSASDADPLFNSWHWQSLWWRVYGSHLANELCVLAVSCKDSVVGIAPFYVQHERRLGVLKVRSLQLIGMAWRNPDTLISEYLDIIAQRGFYAKVRELCMDKLDILYPGSEIVIASTRASESWADALRTRSDVHGGYVRTVDGSISYQADLTRGFADYVARLSQSARRALKHSRRRLQQLGTVDIIPVNAHQVREGLREMNALHAKRWGSAAFQGRRLEFHEEFAAVMAEKNALRMSRLIVGDRPVSVAYDVTVDGCQYNLQIGFDESFKRGISLGLLHLGYSMENAAKEGGRVYDFLAGSGKNTDYKYRLASRQANVCSVQYAQGACLSTLYRWYDRWSLKN